VLAKACAILVVSFTGFAYWLPVTHIVKAPAEIIPTERRVIPAPNKGFVKSVFVNAGDHVLAGEILLQLDTRELELQQTSQENELSSARTELRAAMASYDRKEMAIAQARIDQIKAELALTRQQISRSAVTAPIDGLIISGDMSQTLGMTVERGNVLMEMSPAEGFEVQLLVHEVDIPYVKIGQMGKLSLAANPGHELPVEINAIHPIAKASEGASRFMVETILENPSIALRPGQTGVVKLNVGEATLLWVWTHRFLEWARQQLWQWFA
jgi:multidrug resistance efflux pump